MSVHDTIIPWLWSAFMAMTLPVEGIIPARSIVVHRKPPNQCSIGEFVYHDYFNGFTGPVVRVPLEQKNSLYDDGTAEKNQVPYLVFERTNVYANGFDRPIYVWRRIS